MVKTLPSVGKGSGRVGKTRPLAQSEIVPDGSTGASIQERESRSKLKK
jgi:hypothetical protein